MEVQMAPSTSEGGNVDITTDTNELGESQNKSSEQELPRETSYAPPPPSIAETIEIGKDLRRKFKSILKDQYIIQKSLPKPVKPWQIKETDNRKISKVEKACMKRYKPRCSVRTSQMSRPHLRYVLHTWKECGNVMPIDMIVRLRELILSDETYNLAQAYEFFSHIMKTKKKLQKLKKKNEKAEQMNQVWERKKFSWLKSTIVAFTQAIQRELSIQQKFNLSGRMLGLSDVLLVEFCRNMKMRIPNRSRPSPKGELILEIADKVAVWLMDVVTDADYRMLDVDEDEDEDILYAEALAQEKNEVDNENVEDSKGESSKENLSNQTEESSD